MHAFQNSLLEMDFCTGTGPSLEAPPPSSSVQEVKMATKTHLLVYIGLRFVEAKTVSPVDYFVLQQPIAREDSKLITACTTEMERLDSTLSTASERERESKRKREKETDTESSKQVETHRGNRERERERER